MDPNIDEIASECKRIIARRARHANFEFFDEDIVDCEHEGSRYIFLRRRFAGWDEWPNGLLKLDDNFDPIPLYEDLIWIECLDRMGHIFGRFEQQKFRVTFHMAKPRVVVKCPWLVFIVLPDGQVKSRDAPFLGDKETSLSIDSLPSRCFELWLSDWLNNLWSSENFGCCA